MKKYILGFIHRGLLAAGFGPVILSILYWLQADAIGTLTPQEAAFGILTVTLLAFIAAGSGVVYTIEKLPLVYAALIQGAVMYADYFLIYLLNGWLKSQIIPILIFTAAFVLGYGLVWLIIYLYTKSRADRINKKLRGE